PREFGFASFDFDPDTDTDLDAEESITSGSGRRGGLRRCIERASGQHSNKLSPPAGPCENS
ncbi:MAG: hypothetical protein ACLFUY_04275, partial [Desulfobacterales bacterium]